jgi:hypothetical protein
MEARTEAIYGIAEPSGGQINATGGETANCLPDADPDQPAP